MLPSIPKCSHQNHPNSTSTSLTKSQPSTGVGVGFPPPGNPAVMSSHGANRDVADHLATAGFQVGWFSFLQFLVGVWTIDEWWCWHFLHLMYIYIYMIFFIFFYTVYDVYIYCRYIYIYTLLLLLYVAHILCCIFFRGLHCLDEWMTLWFLSWSLTLAICALLDPTYIWVLDSSHEIMCVGKFYHLIHIPLYILM